MILNAIKACSKYFKKIYISKQVGVVFKNKCQIGWNSTFEGKNIINERVAFGESHIGFGSYIGSDSQISNTLIGRYTSIGPGVKTILGAHPSSTFVSTHPCFFSLLKQSGFSYVSEQLFDEVTYLDKANKISVIIGNDVWIGANVLIMAGLTIGNGAIIAAGAVVTKDVEPYGIYGGVPAKKVRSRFNDKEIEYLLNLKWWDKKEKWIRENASLFNDISNLMAELP
jgi:acetyltransferase-like isoleucine patch superfamily enzyme